MHPDHARAEARGAHGVGHHLAVVLVVDPRLRRVVRAGQQRLQAVDGVDLGHVRKRCGFRCRHMRAVVFRRAGRQLGQRQVGHAGAVVHDEEAVLGDGLADDGEVEVPLVEDCLGLCLLRGVEHHQHAFLRFRQHHLVGGHVGFALRHVLEVEPDAEAALVAHLYRRAGQACRAHVLDRDHGAGLHQLQRRFHQALFGERVANLNGGAFFLDALVELGGGHGRTADTVTAGLGAQVDDGTADARSGGVEDLVGVCEARGKGVHEAVAVVGLVETGLAADGRDAEGIAVAADPFHHTVHELAGLGMLRRAEGQRVHRGDGTGAHGEDVAQDAAHAGRSTLIGFDVRGVVVAFHLEDHGLPVADVHDARVLAGAADDLRAGCRQLLEVNLRGFVGTVLVPHRAEDAQFGERGLAIQDAQDLGIFVRLDPVGRDQIFGDVRFLHVFPLTWRCAPRLRQGRGRGKGARGRFGAAGARTPAVSPAVCARRCVLPKSAPGA